MYKIYVDIAYCLIIKLENGKKHTVRIDIDTTFVFIMQK